MKLKAFGLFQTYQKGRGGISLKFKSTKVETNMDGELTVFQTERAAVGWWRQRRDLIRKQQEMGRRSMDSTDPEKQLSFYTFPITIEVDDELLKKQGWQLEPDPELIKPMIAEAKVFYENERILDNIEKNLATLDKPKSRGDNEIVM